MAKKINLTNKMAKNSPQGGVLVGKKDGQTIIYDDGKVGGWFVGKTHKEGGIQGLDKTTGQPIEVQLGEVIITAPALADQTPREFQGKMMTNRQILSKINSDAGGVAFADGGEVPSKMFCKGGQYKYGGKMMSDKDIVDEINKCGCDHEEKKHLSEGMSLEDIAKLHNVSVEDLDKQVEIGMKDESIHAGSYKDHFNIVKDHLVESPTFYTDEQKSKGEIEKFKDGGYVTYKDKYNKKYNYDKNTSHDLEQISKDTGLSIKGLQQIYNKGIGAYKTNPSSVRPNVKSKEQWAMARVYSAVMGGADARVDANELKMNHGGEMKKENLVKDAKSGNTPARDLNNYNDMLDVQADGKVGGDTGIDMDGAFVGVGDGTGGADASGGVGVFAKGGDLSFLDEVDKHFAGGGEAGLPKIKSIKITGVGSPSVYGDFVGKVFNNYIELIESLKDIFIEKEKRASYFYFTINDTKDRFGIQFKNGKNTVLNFNPLTGNYTDFEKQILRRYPTSSKRFDWNDFLNSRNREEESTPESNLKKVNRIEVEFIFPDGQKTTESFYNIFSLTDAFKVEFKLGCNYAGLKIYSESELLNIFGLYFRDNPQLDLEINPSKIDAINLGLLLGKQFREYEWTKFFTAPKRENDNKSLFTQGEIEMFKQIDEILTNNNLKILAVAFGKFSDEKEFIIKNPSTSQTFALVSFERSLGALSSASNSDGALAIIKMYEIFKKSKPDETSKKDVIKKLEIVFNFKREAPNNLDVMDGVEFATMLRKEFGYGSIKADISIFNQNNEFLKTYGLGLTENPTADWEVNPNLETRGTLKERFTREYPQYDWEEFFSVEEKESTKEETKKESKPELSTRNFVMERKFLTNKINSLAKELDMKRPILSNEEVGFYQREINATIKRLRFVNDDEMSLKPMSERVDSIYSVKWGDYDKQYPETDLKSINGTKSELTQEEYLAVRTDGFKSFFGDWELAYETGIYSGVSKIINPKTKEPQPVFHGTNVLFTDWKVYETNNLHYFAVKRQMSEFFAKSWEQRSDKAGVDSKALKQLNPNKGKFLYRCFLDIRNPIDLSRFGVEKRPVREFLAYLKINYNIGDYDFWTRLANQNNFTQETKVFAWQIIRNWQSFTKYVKTFTTYDGYIFYEYIPDIPQKTIDDASLSFCAFESNQIKFDNAVEFNALSNDSRFDLGGNI